MNIVSLIGWYTEKIKNIAHFTIMAAVNKRCNEQNSWKSLKYLKLTENEENYLKTIATC